MRPSSSHVSSGAGALSTASSGACSVGGGASDVAPRSSQRGAGIANAGRDSVQIATVTIAKRTQRRARRNIRGVLWIGTAGGGLSRWREGQLANFSTREGLPDNTINQILEDDSERLWLGSNRGLASVRKRDLEKPASSGNIEVFPRVYGLADGMPSEECTGGFCPAGLRSSTGLLWFSTLRGLVAADPRPPRGEPPVPQVILEEVLVDGLVPAPDSSGHDKDFLQEELRFRRSLLKEADFLFAGAAGLNDKTLLTHALAVDDLSVPIGVEMGKAAVPYQIGPSPESLELAVPKL